MALYVHSLAIAALPDACGRIAQEAVMAISELGVMFLLFRVGLEVEPEKLMKLGATATIVAICGVALPFAMGWGIMALWGSSRIEAIFVGAALVATSVGITAQVLASKGLLQERASQIILAAAVIDDVLGLLIMAFVSSMAKGKVNVLEIAITAGLAVAFVVVIAVWGNRTMGRVVPRVQQTLRVAEAEYAFAMILLFTLSVLASYIGVAAIVGAFFAGLALAGRVRRRVTDLAHGATELLVPFFLAGIGLHVHLDAFRNPSLILLASIVLLAAIVSKFVACGLSSWRLGAKDAIRIGIGMVPRGEVGMVVAQIGLSMAVLSQEVYSVVVLMAVGTTLVAPPLLKLAFEGVRPSGISAREETFRLG